VGNGTALFTATWETLGTTLTWPTTYVAYSNFGLAPKCTGTTSALHLPQSTDPARLVFPLGDAQSVVSSNVADYLDSLHIVDNATDLSECSWAVSQSNLAARWGNVPIPFGRLGGFLGRRVVEPGNGTNVRDSNLKISTKLIGSF
jgi:hypothetical protein